MFRALDLGGPRVPNRSFDPRHITEIQGDAVKLLLDLPVAAAIDFDPTVSRTEEIRMKLFDRIDAMTFINAALRAELVEEARKIETELEERREEVENLETELSAARLALDGETKDADKWSKEAKVSHSLIAGMYEALVRAGGKVPAEIAEAIGARLALIIVKGGKPA